MTETLTQLSVKWRLAGNRKWPDAGAYHAYFECADELEAALVGIARQQHENAKETTRPSGAAGTEQGAGERPLTRIE